METDINSDTDNMGDADGNDSGSSINEMYTEEQEATFDYECKVRTYVGVNIKQVIVVCPLQPSSSC